MSEQNKLGLSLSGGGFRAAFYHLGVLARMAELGLLKKVEVISTVSGGSIVGAAYYILLKKMLETYDDNELTDQHYIDLVAELEQDFRLSVRNNLRWRTFANPWANMKMALDNFSRSDQIGILYDKFIYQQLIKTKNKSKADSSGIFSSINAFFSFWLTNPKTDITQLKIYPKGDPTFHPYQDNVNRTAKVPILVLNATSLNSGHNWTFTASAMGEIPPNNPEVNKADRYLHIKYEDIQQPREKGFLLGKAVASSASVPGAFPPLPISNLYPNETTIQLIDGGVFDNMGIAGLKNNPKVNITHFVVSDASGQGESSNNPATGFFSVVLGTTNLLMARVREKMITGLQNQHPDNVAYFHLNKGVAAVLHTPLGAEPPEPPTNSSLDFGVEPEMQHALSQVRTDLDSFSDKEAYALELDGYLMSNKALRALSERFDHKVSENSHDWVFQSVSLVKSAEDYTDLLKHIDIAQYKVFKLFHFDFLKALLAHLPVIAVLIILLCGGYAYIKNALGFDLSVFLQNQTLIYYALVLIAAKVIETVAEKRLKGSAQVLKVVQFVTRIPAGIFLYVILPIFISLPILVYLVTANKFFIYQGRVNPLTSHNNKET
jgi:NTE family protein